MSRIVISKQLESGKYQTVETYELEEARMVDFSAMAGDYPGCSITVFTDSLVESAQVGEKNPDLRRDGRNPLRLWVPTRAGGKPLPSKY